MNFGSVNSSGPQTINNEQRVSVNHSGPIECNNLVVTGSMVVNGPAQLNCSTVNDLTVHGQLSLSESSVNNLSVNGHMNLSKSNVNNPKVHGAATITNSSIITGSALTVYGSVKITDSEIRCASILASNQIEVQRSSLLGIIVEKGGSSYGLQEKLVLKNSRVNGDILFKSGQGLVESSASVISGRIIGGQLIIVNNGINLGL